MIKLKKIEEPKVLVDNSAKWTRVILDKLAAKIPLTKAEKGHYNHPEIKRALVLETHGKCAYCESKIRHIGFGDTEHITPKSENPELWFCWANLTLACDICNTNKSDASVDDDQFVDPYRVDPEEHFWQLGAMIRPRPGCDAAALTECLIQLNRTELLERRTERLNNLLRMLDVFEKIEQPVLKAGLWVEFCREADASREYAALARSIVELAKQRLGEPREVGLERVAAIRTTGTV